MKLIVAIFGSLLLLAVAAFCLFGFLATYEPTDKTTQFMMFRIGHAVVGIGCMIGVGLLILGAMIFFNIHRERILRQYEGFLAEERWD